MRAIPAVPRRWLLWLSLLGSPTLWLLHFLGAYLVTEAGCSEPGALPTPAALLLAATALVALASAALTVLAYRTSRRAAASRPVFDDFLPHVGWMMGVLFTFVILVEGVAALIVRLC